MHWWRWGLGLSMSRAFLTSPMARFTQQGLHRNFSLATAFGKSFSRVEMEVFFSSLKSLLSISLLSLFLLSGCSPFYVMRAAYEESKILWRREPIERLLKTPDLEPEAREKFKLVLAVREYARDSLKLKVGGSYASYSYVDRPVLSYVLMAAPKTDLKPYTWWYFFVGRVPYKGLFSEEAAKAEAERFHARSTPPTSLSPFPVLRRETRKAPAF